jgi:hypothetical protein
MDQFGSFSCLQAVQTGPDSLDLVLEKLARLFRQQQKIRSSIRI